MTRTVRFVLRGLSCLPCLLGVAHAATLSDNLFNTSAGFFDDISHEKWEAQQFTTDGLSYALENVTLLMSRGSGTGDATVQIWSHDTINDTPASALFTLSSPGSYSTGLDLTPTAFTPSGPAVLAPNVSYWVVLRSASEGTLFNWSWTPDGTGNGVGFSANWTETSNSGGNWLEVSSSDPFQMQVNATAVVPEPEHVAMATLALAVPLGVLLRRARRR